MSQPKSYVSQIDHIEKLKNNLDKMKVHENNCKFLFGR